MTYKKIVASIVAQKAQWFVEHTLELEGYDKAGFVLFMGDVKFEHDKEGDLFLWDVDVNIHLSRDPVTYRVRVGGTVDDMCGVCYSVIWNRKDIHDILWMANAKTRRGLGIEKFDLSNAM